MKKVVLSVMGAAAMFATPALAADMIVKARPAPAPVVSAWDIAFGGALMTDYNFRGISQSDRGPAVSAYFEPRFNLNANFQFYAGVAGSSVKLPTDPSAEIDLYAGVRPVFGALSFDFGFMYYWYPKERQLFINGAPPPVLTPVGPGIGAWTMANTDFWEAYAKVAYAFNDNFSVGANFFYAANWLNSGASGTYAAGTAKFTSNPFANGATAYVSGELGRYWLGTTNNILALGNLPDYTYWNIGAGVAWKALTLDIRYHDTTLSSVNCGIVSGDPRSAVTGRSNWCSPTVIGKLSFDTTINALK